jgi:hypothetical protein
LDKNQVISVELAPDESELNEVVLKGEQERVSETPQMSIVSIPIQQIKDIPALLGEKDVLKVLQLMPGVKSGGEGTSGLYVRGGGPDQNLIILDDATVYNASHLFGFFSLFNGNALKSVELTKGGFPARYGGRLSSVVDMTMKDGHKEEFHGEGSIGLISSSLTLEGPIKKGKSSFIVSGRRTYLDLLVRPFLPANQKGGYYFYDLNAKINYNLSPKDRVYLSGYFGQDKFWAKDSSDPDYTTRVGLFWGNATSTVRWNHLFNDKVFSNLSLIYSNYNFVINAEEKETDNIFSLKYISRIRDFGAKYDIDFAASPKHNIKTGVLLLNHRFTPSAVVIRDDYSGTNQNNRNAIDVLEGGVYVEDVFRPSARFSANVGFRASYFGYKNTHYFYPEPRASLAYHVKENLAIKASYAVMNQYLHLLSNTGAGLPTDLWVPSTDRVKPQQSQQVALGIAKDLPAQKLTLTVEGYYKHSRRVLGYKEGASFLLLDDPENASAVDWQNNVTQGQGWAYGGEFLLQKKEGKFSGWIGYTLSWTQLQFDELNFGKKFFARFDRRHDISLVGIYKPTEKITLSAIWVYGTGNAITLPLANYTADDRDPLGLNGNSYQVSDYGQKNDFRMRSNNRLDFGIQFHKKKTKHERTWELSVYNVYNRKNPFFYYISQENGQSVLKQVSIFGFIPSFAYRFKF